MFAPSLFLHDNKHSYLLYTNSKQKYEKKMFNEMGRNLFAFIP